MLLQVYSTFLNSFCRNIMASTVQITDGTIGILALFGGLVILILLFSESPKVTMGTIIGVIALVYGFYALRASK